MTRRFRPTYAGVTSTVALFLALGGGAYAAASLPAHSVGARQLKHNAVTRAAIKRNAVDGSKVANGSLTGADIRVSTLGKVPSATAADSATNATNATNAVHAGAAAALDRVTYKTAAGSAAAQSPGVATATCDAGQHVVGGGVQAAEPSVALVVDSYPSAAGTAWSADVWNSNDTGGPSTTFTVYAICTSVTATG
jgi:hypothetical protein